MYICMYIHIHVYCIYVYAAYVTREEESLRKRPVCLTVTGFCRRLDVYFAHAFYSYAIQLRIYAVLLDFIDNTGNTGGILGRVGRDV